MNIHGPSIAIGAGITVLAVFAAFFVFDSTNVPPEPETVLEVAQLPEPEPQQISMDVFLGNGSPILGDPNAPITLVEFGDYQCFFCNRFFHETEEQIIVNYVDKGLVKIIFKDFTIIGPDSVNAAHAAHCANDQGMFWQYHDTLYNNWNGENNGWASSENLHQFAVDLDLDVDLFTQCMVDATHQAKIIASNEDAATLGLTGTPGFFVIGPTNNISKIPGAQPFESFERLFESELQG